MRISVDGRRIRNNKVAFSNLSGIVWTRPHFHMDSLDLMLNIHKSSVYMTYLQLCVLFAIQISLVCI